MVVFKGLIYLFAVIAIATGVMDLLKGLPALELAGGKSVQIGATAPMIDNSFRFLAGVWIGAGILFILFVSNLEQYKIPMMVLLGVMAIGGIGRLISIANYGMPTDAVVYVGLVIELIICPLMILWLAFYSPLSKI